MTKSLVILLGLLSALDAFAIDAYLPAMPSIAEAMGRPETAIQLTLSVFLVGLGIGQGIFGPLLDRFGRRKPMLIGMLIYILGSILCAVSNSVEVLMFARFIQALGAAPGLVTPRVVVADLCEGPKAARLFTTMMQVTLMGAICAPVLGNLMLMLGDWRFIFIVLSIAGVLGYLWCWFTLPDSLPREKRNPIKPVEILKSYWGFVKAPAYFSYLLASSLTMGAFFTYLGNASFAFIGHYQLSVGFFTLIFTFNSLLFLAGGVLSNKLLSRGLSIVKVATSALLIQLVLALLLTLLVVGDVASLAVYTVLIMPLITVQGMIAGNLTAMTMSEVKSSKGIASSLMGVLQYLISGAVGFAASHLFSVLMQVPATMCIAAIAALGLVSIAGRSIKKERASQSGSTTTA